MTELVARNLLGSITMVMFFLNTVLWFIPIMIVSIFKLLIPVDAWRVVASQWLMRLGENWISFNRGIIGLRSSGYCSVVTFRNCVVKVTPNPAMESRNR